MIITRFAPSPTGRLHLGHAASALFAYRAAQEADGRFLLRIEDIDPVRCKPEYTEGIFEDLCWLGLTWPKPVRLQSEYLVDYQNALDQLRAMGLLYPCFCTRKEVLAEAAASGYAPHEDGGEGLYAGTCRALTPAQREEKALTRVPVWRLDIAAACKRIGELSWIDLAAGKVEAHPERFGDVVLARRDVATSYHLSVVVDDALQGVTLVTRGQDLFGVTDVHVLLQSLLGMPQPTYHHHPLIVDAHGKRLAKRDRAATIQLLRQNGSSPQDVIDMTYRVQSYARAITY
ncbi:MAG TPA: tRNA glutamyl-Q(34) synthetase GluQRS [Rhodospirillaceae bacterium]|nr:tRNA glutamyl-Q(34) synthetase GluQRS [Rhodospirillaceae bacterium]